MHVDVVVPSYNYGRYLERCVTSIVGQRGVDVRVLVIDDASTDETPLIAKSLAQTDPRVHCRRHETNAGHIATYNEGLLGWARAPYALLISADDMLAPGALKRAVVSLEAHPDASFAWGRQACFDDVPPVVPEDESVDSVPASVTTGPAFIAEVSSSGHNPVATPTVVVRTSVQQAAGGYEAILPHTADLEMWLRLATRGSVVSIDAVQAFKRLHGRNMQLAYVTNPEGDIPERREAFRIFFERHGRDTPDAAVLMAGADRALADEVFWRAAGLFEAGNIADCDRLLAIAASIAPAISATRHWRRMAVKRRLGSRAWSVVQALSGQRT